MKTGELKKKWDEKKMFVLENLPLFESAYLQYINAGKRYRNKLRNPAYSEFITQARAKFNYSPNTSSVDIWTKFQFVEINKIILEEARVKRQIHNLKLRNLATYIK